MGETPNAVNFRSLKLRAAARFVWVRVRRIGKGPPLDSEASVELKRRPLS